MFTFGTALTAPGFVTIGSMLAIPVSAIVDRFLRGVSFPALKIGGTVAVVLGFLALNIDGQWLWQTIKNCCLQDHLPYTPIQQEDLTPSGSAVVVLANYHKSHTIQ